MNSIHKTVFILISACLLLALGGSLGWWLAKQAQPAEDHAAPEAANKPDADARQVLYWYDPMMPQQHFDQPGKSPFMDMELLPKYADAAEAGNQDKRPGLSIDPEVSENIGIRLATVSRTPLSREIQVSGLLTFNERDVAIVQARAAGFVEHVSPLAEGDVIKAGQALAEILVPDWAAAQQELLAVRSMADNSLLNAARERLQLLGMPNSLIRRLEKSGRVQTHYTISAPIDGVIQSLEVRNGMTLMSGQTLARINGIATIWLEAAVPEAQADLARIGTIAKVSLDGYSGHDFDAPIKAILPTLNDASRSIRVRLELSNPKRQLRPGQSAQVKLSSTSQNTALTIPSEALIRTGKRTLVMLAHERGRYAPVEVTVGHEIGDQTQIIAGLEAGQQVVSSGQFLVDSEASLNGIEARALPNTPHQHMQDAAP